MRESIFSLFFHFRWADLPNMPTGRHNASALCLQSRPEAVLVVGGYDSLSPEASRCAELLIHTAGASGGGGGGDAWRWRKLNQMLKDREIRPGMVLLSGGDRQRVLVAGGWGSSTAEIFKLSCSDPSDRGQWTLIAPPLMECYPKSLFVWSDRIFATGSLLSYIKPSISKDFL